MQVIFFAGQVDFFRRRNRTLEGITKTVVVLDEAEGRDGFSNGARGF